MFVGTELSTLFQNVIRFEELIDKTKEEYVKHGLIVMSSYISKHNINFETIYDVNNVFMGYGFSSSEKVKECFDDIKSAYEKEFTNQKKFSDIVVDAKFSNNLTKRVSRFTKNILDYTFLSLNYAFIGDPFKIPEASKLYTAIDCVSKLELIIRISDDCYFSELYKADKVINLVYNRCRPIKCISHQFIMKKPIVSATPQSVPNIVPIVSATPQSVPNILPIVSATPQSVPNILPIESATPQSVAYIPIKLKRNKTRQIKGRKKSIRINSRISINKISTNVLAQAITSTFDFLKSTSASKSKKNQESLMVKFILKSQAFKNSMIQLAKMITRSTSKLVLKKLQRK